VDPCITRSQQDFELTIILDLIVVELIRIIVYSEL